MRKSLFGRTKPRGNSLKCFRCRIISKSAPYLGEARVELDGEYKGKDMAIGFNPEYLIDVLKNTDQEKISFELSDPEKPGAIRIGAEYVYVVLPMHLG